MKEKLLILALLFSPVAMAGDLVWETDFAAAQERAKKENKQILINFSGSDWCGWCKRLDREVFSKKEFSSFVNDELILVLADFPRHKKLDSDQENANRRLAAQYGVQGFPTVYLVDANANVLLKTGYRPGGPGAYISHLKPHVN